MAASCSGGGSSGGPAAAFVGGAAVDEPYAAVAARDILAAGGSAADAATAAYFTLSVTMSSSASLGGSGVCLAFDPRLGRVEAVDFMARPGTTVPIPMSARGFFLMQGRFGRLRWEQMVAPAEGMARFGVPVSRALARDLADNAAAIAQSPALSRLFRPNGVLLKEGDRLVQTALAETLSFIRSRGAKEFHEGRQATEFAAAAQAAGASFTAAELVDAAPQFRAPVSIDLQGTRVIFAPPPANIGIYEAQLMQMLAPRWTAVPPGQQPQLFVYAQTLAMVDAQRWSGLDLSDAATLADSVSAPRAASLMAEYRPNQRAAMPGANLVEDPATTTIVAADRDGGAVACALTVGGPFGSGRIAKGVILAAPSQAAGRGVTSLSTMMAIRSYGTGFSLSPRANTAQLAFAGASGGGRGAAASLVATGLVTLVERRTLDEAMDRPRVMVPGGVDQVLAEPGAAARYPVLGALGYTLVEAPALGRINAIYCADGLIDEPTSCRVRTDIRGHGLAVGGVR